MSNSPRYARPHMSLIEETLPGWGVDLYIGGREAVCDPALLAAHDIKVIVNCAVNFDVNFVTGDHPASEGTLVSGPGLLRYYKLGLVDDAGNSDTMLLSGYYLLRGALDQTFPDRPSYPHRDKGNVLVNCRAGRSRSVALVALFLHLEMPGRFLTLESAIGHVREKRELHPDEWFETPKPELTQAAERAASMVRLVEAEKSKAVA
jgi:hypothetical protein